MKYLKTFMFEIIIYISLTIITTILYYFNVLNTNINNIFKIIIFIITFFTSGIYISKNSNKKYYLEGLKISCINILIFTIMSFILKSSFNFRQFLYYILLLVITILGSIVGGNFKKNKN